MHAPDNNTARFKCAVKKKNMKQHVKLKNNLKKSRKRCDLIKKTSYCQDNFVQIRIFYLTNLQMKRE